MNKFLIGGGAASVVLLAVLAASADRPQIGGGGAPPAPAPAPVPMVPLELATVRNVALSCTTDETAQLKVCDTKGQCHVARQSCFPYKCDGSARTCAASCANNAGCATGTECRSGRCVIAPPPRAHCKPGAPNVSIAPDGIEVNCGVYVCDRSTGACLKQCGGTDDCAPASLLGGARANACNLEQHRCEVIR